MRRFIIKLILIILICVTTISIFYPSFVKADFIKENFTGEIEDIDSNGGSKIKTVLNVVLKIVRTVGTGIAVLILMILGCKYMMASAGERAEIKKYAITYVIGAIILFSASQLVGIVQKFMENSAFNNVAGGE